MQNRTCLAIGQLLPKPAELTSAVRFIRRRTWDKVYHFRRSRLQRCPLSSSHPSCSIWTLFIPGQFSKFVNWQTTPCAKDYQLPSICELASHVVSEGLRLPSDCQLSIHVAEVGSETLERHCNWITATPVSKEFVFILKDSLLSDMEIKELFFFSYIVSGHFILWVVPQEGSLGWLP